jgi:CBS domain-containing protein
VFTHGNHGSCLTILRELRRSDVELTESWRNNQLDEVMTGGVIGTSSDASLYDAQRLLTESKLTRLVVTSKSGELRGIITRRDLVRFLNEDKSGRPLDAMRVREAMTTPVVTLRPTDKIIEAARAMNKKGMSSVVITDKANEVLGMVTKTDLCFQFSLFPSKEKVKDYMTQRVFTVRPTHSIFFVLSVLARHGISRVLVFDGKLRGIITLSDMVKKAPYMRAEIARPSESSGTDMALMAPSAKLTAMTAMEIMTSNPLTMTPEEALSRASELMIEHGFSGLPVVDSKSRIRGIVTKSDIVRAIAA